MNALVGTVPTLWVLSLQHQPCLHKVGGCLVLCLHAHVELCCPAKCITSSCGVGERGGKGEGGGEREREKRWTPLTHPIHWLPKPTFVSLGHFEGIGSSDK